MKKLRLGVDTLEVQSFAAGAEPELRGTVRGNVPETHPNVCPYSKNWYCSVGACTEYPEYCY